MVHQYKNNGYDIVLDVNSGAIHVVDDVTYDVIALFEDHSREEIIAQLQSRYRGTGENCRSNRRNRAVKGAGRPVYGRCLRTEDF